jgi:hypothetical protein
MKILVFTEGTLFTHQSWLGLSRQETVRRVQEGDRPGYAGTVPIGRAALKLQAWKRAGAEIVYLTSCRDPAEIEKVRAVLEGYAFPVGEVFYRRAGEAYAEAAVRVLPDMIVEDDCESIGGEVEMTYPRIPAGIKEKIKSIVVQEFGGVDHLPDDLASLANYTAAEPDS